MRSGELFGLPPMNPPKATTTPLAERMRPRTLDEFIGQDSILASGQPLREAIIGDTLQSIILWGPPGTGKTTLARLIASMTKAKFVAFSAVLSGIKEIRSVMEAAESGRRHQGQRTILFVDEIHRFNRAQQDAFLPRVEAGDIVLIGATTENPSFEVNAALLSRSRVFVLTPLTVENLVSVLQRALTDPDRGLAHKKLTVATESLEAIARHASGDARVALNLLELSATIAATRDDKNRRASQKNTGAAGIIDNELISKAVQRRSLVYDKSGEEHFNLISALHKSMRNSDADAAIYWLARMIEAGEDPMYIARRLVRFASEDIGNADPQALSLAVAAKEAVHFIGMPEGNTALAQATLYLSVAPKSNAVYVAYGQAAHDAHNDIAEPVPLHLRNAPTKLMKNLDYGKDYQYAHDHPEGTTAMKCLPPQLENRRYYTPRGRGAERVIRERMSTWRETQGKKQMGTKD